MAYTVEGKKAGTSISSIAEENQFQEGLLQIMKNAYDDLKCSM